MSFKDHFSSSASGYSRFRPHYPDSLFRWLAEIAPGRERAWDAATGTGQAAVGLAPHFEEVVATDASGDQIRHARAHPVVRYRVARSEDVPLEAASADLILVAQAMHWFEFGAFFREVRRVARPRGIFAAVSYGLFRIEDDIDREIDQLYSGALGDFWPAERRYVDEAYASIPFPFEELAAPDFQMQARWEFDQLLGYLRTWSAVNRYRDTKGADPVADVEPALRRLWGEPGNSRGVRWPLALRVGRV
jgi:SAM-dependent methyltransferase